MIEVRAGKVFYRAQRADPGGKGPFYGMVPSSEVVWVVPDDLYRREMALRRELDEVEAEIRRGLVDARERNEVRGLS